MPTSTEVSAASIPRVLFGSSLPRFLGPGLQERIECRRDAQSTTVQLRVPLLVGVAQNVGTVQEVVAHRFGEVRALGRPVGARPDALGQHEGLLDLEPLPGREQFVFLQAVEYLQKPHSAPLGIDDRVVARRRLHHAGEERRLDERQLRHRFGEVGLGSRTDAVRVLAEEDRVEVALEDLRLRLLLLEPNRIRRLQHLVATVPLEPGHVVVLHDLHRDRRSPLDGTLGGEVRQCGSKQAADVDAAVHPELVVLHRQERLDHVVGHVIEPDRLAVLDLERRDLATRHVEHVRALGEVGEVGQPDRDLLMGVRDPPEPRRDRDHAGREEQGARTDDQRHSKNPAEARHSGIETTDGIRSPGGSDPPRSPRRRRRAR